MIAAARMASAPHVNHSATGDTLKSLKPNCGATIKAADQVNEYVPM
jgi:hypothetical protein